MSWCLGGGAAKRRLDDTEAEHAELAEEARRLREKLAASQEELRGVLAEISATASWAQEERDAADRAEAVHSQLSLECQEEVAAHLALAAPVASKEGAQLPRPQPSTDAGLADSHRELVEHENEAVLLEFDIRSTEAEIAAVREDDSRGIGALEAAECEAARLHAELGDIHAHLALAQREGKQLEDERYAAQAEEVPLRAWVQRAESELREARYENGELVSQLADLNDHKGGLWRDQQEASKLREAGFDPHGLSELQVREREHLARQAALSDQLSGAQGRQQARPSAAPPRFAELPSPPGDLSFASRHVPTGGAAGAMAGKTPGFVLPQVGPHSDDEDPASPGSYWGDLHHEAHRG